MSRTVLDRLRRFLGRDPSDSLARRFARTRRGLVERNAYPPELAAALEELEGAFRRLADRAAERSPARGYTYRRLEEGLDRLLEGLLTYASRPDAAVTLSRAAERLRALAEPPSDGRALELALAEVEALARR